jgi:hypothetical protein
MFGVEYKIFKLIQHAMAGARECVFLKQWNRVNATNGPPIDNIGNQILAIR